MNLQNNNCTAISAIMTKAYEEVLQCLSIICSKLAINEFASTGPRYQYHCFHITTFITLPSTAHYEIHYGSLTERSCSAMSVILRSGLMQTTAQNSLQISQAREELCAAVSLWKADSECIYNLLTIENLLMFSSALLMSTRSSNSNNLSNNLQGEHEPQFSYYYTVVVDFGIDSKIVCAVYVHVSVSLCDHDTFIKHQTSETEQLHIFFTFIAPHKLIQQIMLRRAKQLLVLQL